MNTKGTEIVSSQT